MELSAVALVSHESNGAVEQLQYSAADEIGRRSDRQLHNDHGHQSTSLVLSRVTRVECCSEFGEGDQGPYSNDDCSIRSINVCLIDTPILSFHMSAVKGKCPWTPAVIGSTYLGITMMSAEEPPRRRRGVQIQSFTLHQSNLFKLQNRILHHKKLWNSQLLLVHLLPANLTSDNSNSAFHKIQWQNNNEFLPCS